MKDRSEGIVVDIEADVDGIDQLAEDQLNNVDEKIPLMAKKSLSEADIKMLCEKVVIPFSEALTGVKLFDYQRQLALGVAYSVIKGDGKTITALFARQSGKSETLACITTGLGTILPFFAKNFAAEQFDTYRKNGFMVGIYGPDYEKAGIIHNRIKSRLESKNAQQVLADPALGIDPKKIKGLKFPNGFQADLRSAGKNVKVEGFTYHFIIIDEAQDIDSFTIKKSIRPMKNFYNGTIVYIGTPIPEKCEFAEACHRNALMDIKEKTTKTPYRCHYEFDWTHVARANPNYEKSIKAEMEQIGEDSDEFRLAYKLEWLEARGRALTLDKLTTGAVRERRVDKDYVWYKGKKKESEFIRPHGIVSADRATPGQVFSLDYGGKADSTVMTVARVWWDNPVMVNGEARYHIHIADWLELVGNDNEEQFPKLLDKIDKYDITCGINDATGKGDPIHDRLKKHLSMKGIVLHPFVYSLQSKDAGYKLLFQEIASGRVTFPWSDNVKTYKKHKRFVQQTTDLVKEYKGQNNKYMTVRAPNIQGAHDDYPDSLMMLVWLVNMLGSSNIEVTQNPNFNLKQRGRNQLASYDRLRYDRTSIVKSANRSRFWRNA